MNTSTFQKKENKTNRQATSKKANPFFSPLVIQKKLTIGTSNDAYEVEADRIADKVVNMSDTQVQTKAQTGALVQRKCADCEEEIQKKPITESITPLIQKSSLSTSGEGVASNQITSQINSSKGGGNAMGNDTQNYMESRFGTDFSDVRIHTGSNAIQLSKQLNAQAFTVGNDIYFNEGKYNPTSTSGKHLLAHELTHTLQQGGIQRKKIQKLGSNPNCTAAETRKMHQAIFNARGWILNALSKIDSTPRHSRVLPSLRRNFGSRNGVVGNLPLIRSRIRVAFRTLGSMAASCDTPGTTHFCSINRCGWAVPGSNAATICTNPTSTLDLPNGFGTECLLHESFHAGMSFMNVDHYRGTPTYPGTGSDSLKNADSYASFIRQLS